MKKSKVAPNNEKNNLQLALENGTPVTGMKGFVEVQPCLDCDYDSNDQIVFVGVIAEGLIVDNKTILVKCKVSSSGSVIHIEPTKWINDLKTVNQIKDTNQRVKAAVRDAKDIQKVHYHKLRAKKLQEYLEARLTKSEIEDFMENLKDTTTRTNLSSTTVSQLYEAISLAVCIANKVTASERTDSYVLNNNRY